MRPRGELTARCEEPQTDHRAAAGCEFTWEGVSSTWEGVRSPGKVWVHPGRGEFYLGRGGFTWERHSAAGDPQDEASGDTSEGTVIALSCSPDWHLTSCQDNLKIAFACSAFPAVTSSGIGQLYLALPVARKWHNFNVVSGLGLPNFTTDCPPVGAPAGPTEPPGRCSRCPHRGHQATNQPPHL